MVLQELKRHCLRSRVERPWADTGQGQPAYCPTEASTFAGTAERLPGPESASAGCGWADRLLDGVADAYGAEARPGRGGESGRSAGRTGEAYQLRKALRPHLLAAAPSAYHLAQRTALGRTGRAQGHRVEAGTPYRMAREHGEELHFQQRGYLAPSCSAEHPKTDRMGSPSGQAGDGERRDDEAQRCAVMLVSTGYSNLGALRHQRPGGSSHLHQGFLVVLAVDLQPSGKRQLRRFDGMTCQCMASLA